MKNQTDPINLLHYTRILQQEIKLWLAQLLQQVLSLLKPNKWHKIGQQIVKYKPSSRSTLGL